MKAGMLLIVAGFLTLYGGLHYYIYKKAILVFCSGQGPVVAVFGFLVVAPLLAELLKAAGLFPPAVPMGWIGYTWMGFAFLFFSFSVLLDALRPSVKAGPGLLGVDGTPTLLASSSWSVLATAVLALVATGYGFYAASQIPVERVQIPTRHFILWMPVSERS